MKSVNHAWLLTLLAVMSFIFIIGTNIQYVSGSDDIFATRGDTVTISITLLQNGTFGNPVPDQIVEFYDQSYNTLLGTNRTNSNGVATYEWAIPSLHPLGPTTVNATFRGNVSLFLLPAYQRVQVSIIASTELIVIKNEFDVAPLDIAHIEIQLVDDTDTPVEGAAISIVSENDTITHSTTNSSGYADFFLECNTTWLEFGTNMVDVVYLIDPSRYLRGTLENIRIEMHQLNTVIFSSEYNTDLQLGDLLQISLNISSIEGPLSYSPILVLLDENLLFETTTNEYGNCTAYIPIDDTFQLGINILHIEYPGSARYATCQFPLSVSISTHLIMQVFPLNTAYAGEQAIFEVVATDALNRPIPNYSLNITDLSTGITTVEEFPSNETRIHFSLQLAGPLGNHVIQFHSQSEVSNFISNGTLTINYIVWSKPRICLISSSVDHFASPSQTISLEISASNWQGNLSFQPITILHDGLLSQILTTNLDGVVLVTTTVPKYEGTFNLSLFLDGDLVAFQMATRYDYIIEVTRRMPAEVVLESYEIVFPLKEIVVRLSVRGFNGTLLKGIDTQFRWLENLLSTTSMSNGNIELRLPIPTIEGIHTLDYYLNSTWSLEARNGAFQILVTSLDILSAEGLGFQLVGLSILGSIALVSIPAIARKRLGI